MKPNLVDASERCAAEGHVIVPRGSDPAWLGRLRRHVVALDRVEREFSPDYDRTAYAEPPSRDRLMAHARELYPQAFTRTGRRVRCRRSAAVRAG